MRTLFAAYRVADLERSLDFYTALGYRELGRVGFEGGSGLVVLSFPEEQEATLELVQWPAGHPTGLMGADFPNHATNAQGDIPS